MPGMNNNAYNADEAPKEEKCHGRTPEKPS